MSLRRLRLLFASYGVALGFLSPWNVPQLIGAGLTPAQIGLVLGLAAIASLLAYPAWGLIADTLLGRERTLVLAATLVAVAGAGILASGDQPGWLSVFVVMASVCAAPWAPVADALALGALGDQPRAYGRLRLFTSAGWIGGVLTAGALYAAVGPAPVRALLVASSLVMAVGLIAGRRAPRPARGPAHHAAPRGGRVSLRSLREALRLSPGFLPFLGVLSISAVATYAAYSFISLRILDEGGGPLLIGIAAAMPAFVEIPLFASVGRLTDRFGLRALFSIGCLVTGIQMLVVAFAPQPAIIALVRLLDGAGYALRYTAIVLISGAALPERLRATGQSMSWLIMSGIAPIVSGPTGGWIYGTWGGATLFGICAALMGTASALAWRVLAPMGRALQSPAPEPVPLPEPAEP